MTVIDAYGVGRAHLVGMSLGGLLAQILALRAPQRVASLTLIASEIHGDPGADVPAIDPALLAHFAAAATVDWDDESSDRDSRHRDPVVSLLHARALMGALPSARLVALEGAGHELHSSDWRAIADAVEPLTSP